MSSSNIGQIGHFLIGVPGSGKSTFARQLGRVTGGAIVSTDRIRAQLFGDEAIQGDWRAIEAEAIAQIRATVRDRRPVIYDATNAKRCWRIEMLHKLADLDVLWMAWYLTPPLSRCQQFNRQRDRQVPDAVIEAFYRSLRRFPPTDAEGFARVCRFVPEEDEAMLQGSRFAIASFVREQLDRLPQAIARRRQRQQANAPHPYSRSIDFERLMYEIAAIAEASDSPLNPPPTVASLTRRVGTDTSPFYADPEAIARDLEWIERSHLFDRQRKPLAFQVPEIGDRGRSFLPHPYSDLSSFKRLMQTIRYLLFESPEVLETCSFKELFSRVKNARVETSYHHFRQDLQKVIRPYRIVTPLPFPPRRVV
jgi:predicted kinase